MEQEAQEKIKDTKHDIDEAAHNPVSSFAFQYMMLFMHVLCLPPKDRCIHTIAACFQTGVTQDACLGEMLCTCVSVFPIYSGKVIWQDVYLASED